MKLFRFDANNNTPIYLQISDSLIGDIEREVLPKGHQLPSINEFSEKYAVARDTIEKAYKELKKAGYIISVKGRGYFVVGKKETRLKILLVLNKLSSYKRLVYEGFIGGLGKDVKVDLQIHHYDTASLNEILDRTLGQYHYYVIMPHFFHKTSPEDCVNVLKRVPRYGLLLLDKNIPELGTEHMAVFQDFKSDIYGALSSAVDLLEKYDRLVIIFPGHSNHPFEIVEGASRFCVEQKKMLSLIDSADNEMVKSGTAYLVIAESDLAQLIKNIRSSELRLGQEVGIISFNETVLKELLDITVITTDFEEMGRKAATLIRDRAYIQIRNEFKMIRRNSL